MWSDSPTGFNSRRHALSFYEDGCKSTADRSGWRSLSCYTKLFPCIKVPRRPCKCTRSGRSTASSPSFPISKDGVVGWGRAVCGGPVVTCGHRSRIVTSADWAQGRRVWGSSSVRRHGFEGSTAIGFGSPPGQARATKSQHTKSHCSFLVEARASRVCRTSESRGRLRAKEESHHCLTRSQSRAGGAPPPTVRHPPPTRAEVGGTRAQPGYGTLYAKQRLLLWERPSSPHGPER